MIEQEKSTQPNRPMFSASEATGLTPAEVKVMECLCQGCSNKEIAHRLETADTTAKAHLRSILRQLGARSRSQAVALYIALILQKAAVQRQRRVSILRNIDLEYARCLAADISKPGPGNPKQGKGNLK